MNFFTIWLTCGRLKKNIALVVCGCTCMQFYMYIYMCVYIYNIYLFKI